MDLLSNKIQSEQLTSGDHIYTWRSGYFYSHHGIYVGEGKVIHVTRGPGLIVFSSSPPNLITGDRVVCCSVEEFLSGGDLFRYEYGVKLARLLTHRGGTCSLTPSDPPKDVLHRAYFLLENGFGDYHLFHTNCEDFATYCKTGLLKVDVSTPSRNEQIKFFFAVLFALIFTPYGMLPSTSFTCLSLVFCGSYCVFRLMSDEGVKKVPVEQFDLSYRHTIRIRSEGETSRSLSIMDYFAYAIIALRLWSWIPANRFLLWIRLVSLYDTFRIVISSYLRNHQLRVGEHFVYMIWALGCGYWYRSSENTIFLFSRLTAVSGVLPLLVTDEPGRLKSIKDNMFKTMCAIGIWRWTPESIVLQYVRLVCFHAVLCGAFCNHPIYPRLGLGRISFVCFAIQLTALVMGLDYRDFFNFLRIKWIIVMLGMSI